MMPLVHEQTFPVRFYECDFYGRVNQANYLRYIQEAAFNASTAAGYDADRYEEMGRQWLIRETDITYLRPLAYGDSVVVKTWVVDFRRVRSRRAYELRCAATEELVAAAHTDWVFLDLGAQRPVTVPQDLIAAFYPEGVPEAAPRRARFPKVSAPPDGVFKLGRRVAWRHIDPAHHVNNAMYMSYIEECTQQALDAQGWSARRLIDSGISMSARHCRIEYKQPALVDDEIEVATWLAEVNKTTAVRHYTIRRTADDELLARAVILWEWTNRADDTPTPVPVELITAFDPGGAT